MEHSQATPGENLEDSPKDVSRNRSPKSASARFRSFIGREKDNSNTTTSSTSSAIYATDSTTTPTTTSTNPNNTSPNTTRRPHSVSSPNLVSLLSVRDKGPVLPSRSPQLSRSIDNPPQERPSTANARITTSKIKNVPIYMYLEDECDVVTSPAGPEIVLSPAGPEIVLSPSPEPHPLQSTTTTNFTPIIPSPADSPDPSPRSSPKPTRPSPLPPRRRSESTDATENNNNTNNTNNDPNKPTDAMLRSILASPLMGNAAPFSENPESPEMSFTSPTVLRRPPPRVAASGVSGSTTLDNSWVRSSPSPRPQTLYLGPPPALPALSPRTKGPHTPPRSPISPRNPYFIQRDLNWAGKDLVDLPESAFSSESSILLKLFLARNHLKMLPSSISHLSELTHMDISYNKFEQLPPVEHLVKLKELHLQGNFLLQTDSGLTGLSSLGNLKKLDLSSNQIGNPNPVIPTEVYYLTSLQDLHLPHNGFSSLSSDIAWLTNLTIVDFSHNNFTELPPDIGTLANLKKLNLKRNKLVTLPDEMSQLANLLELDLSHNELSHLPITFAGLYNLITLHLSYNNLTDIPPELFGGGEPIEGEDGQMWVQGMFALKDLKARENQFTTIPEAISNLVDLQVLDLACNKLQDFPFASLANVTKLETLMLAGNQLKEVAEDICTFVSLDTLNLSDNLITTLPENLWQLSSLRHLSISYNQISALPLPPPEETWRSLEELFAAGNENLKEIAPFGELHSLRELYLQNCGFTEVPLLHSTASVPYLEKLDLSHNSISVLGDEFFQMEHLSRLAMSHNQFTSFPSDLSTLRRVEYLDISHNQLTQEPEPVKIMKTSVGTEIITTGNPYTLTQAKPDSANGTSSMFHISMSDLVGRRPTMEDTFSFCPHVGGVEGREAFAIFDGHAGSIASHFVAKYLDRILNSIVSENPSEHPLKWLELTYAKLTELFRQKLNDSKVSGSKHCGTTGLILLVDSDNYYIANVGDTRAVLSRDGKAVRLSTDDKPSNPDEELRIRKLGGFVVVGSEISRVNGTLAVSRSIGDFYMNPYVTSEPHLHEFKREPSDKFIILACDGVWDEISDQHSVDIVAGYADATRASFSLRDKAYAYGSDDNISVMLLTRK